MTAAEHFEGNEAEQRRLLLDYLAKAGIQTTPIVEYPAHSSIEEGKHLRGDLPGTFTKNLLLKDKKGGLFFVTAYEDTDIDLKALHTKIGARGRLGFASIETMIERLRVVPGTATPLALFHDTDREITLVIDQALEGADQLNFHPMSHTGSIGISWAGFSAFAAASGHEPVVVDLTATAEVA
ncbi:YbaK/EbsC family protein [Leucobacter sp. wl10]|uniref:YbaK/EbsC family protein n=1 Tax=Leucobacter sp. wl10 TaxID=2304677 RepID=UPI000E5C50A6|nr:YbaK/EbsC family protein [Leucobacter sp. wl10]RGE20343.1 prolyl-tRNA synthetase associated domain-containing protein [Leucobacter sp. wl10]